MCIVTLHVNKGLALYPGPTTGPGYEANKGYTLKPAKIQHSVCCMPLVVEGVLGTFMPHSQSSYTSSFVDHLQKYCKRSKTNDTEGLGYYTS